MIATPPTCANRNVGIDARDHGSNSSTTHPMFVKQISRWFRRPSDPSGNVYYVRLKTPQGVFYKLGYTSKPTLEARMAYAGAGDERLIDRQLLFSFRRDAWDVEQTLLDHFDKHRAFGKFSNDPKMPLAGRGQSELFKRDILGIDDELYKVNDATAKAIQADIDKSGQGCLFVLIGLALAPFTLGISLFFIAGGLSDVFGSARQSAVTHDPANMVARPRHPPKIKELIDALQTR